VASEKRRRGKVEREERGHKPSKKKTQKSDSGEYREGKLKRKRIW